MAPTLSQLLALLLTLTICGCAKSAVLPASQGAEFNPIAFFEGHTHGEGNLHKLFGQPVHVSVDSVGRMGRDGLVLEQTIREAARPPSTRRWTIRRISQNRYIGTLTDAVGPVTAKIVGPRADIRYKMRHGLIVEQQLAQQGDGTTVLNRLVVRKFGARVATLSETIKKVSP